MKRSARVGGVNGVDEKCFKSPLAPLLPFGTLKYSKEDMLFLRDSYSVDKLKTEADELANQH